MKRDRGIGKEREREERVMRENGMSAESRWRGTRELTAFITAFSPCHGLSLRHSLQAIERQAICTPLCTLAALYTSTR